VILWLWGYFKKDWRILALLALGLDHGAVCRELTSTCILNGLVRSLHMAPDGNKNLFQNVSVPVWRF